MMRYDISPETDSIDIKIIEELAKNSKITCKDLSDRVNLSIPRVYERTKKLEERGIIAGYHAKIDLEKLGYEIHAFILVKRINTSGICSVHSKRWNVYMIYGFCQGSTTIC